MNPMMIPGIRQQIAQAMRPQPAMGAPNRIQPQMSMGMMPPTPPGTPRMTIPRMPTRGMA